MLTTGTPTAVGILCPAKGGMSITQILDEMAISGWALINVYRFAKYKFYGLLSHRSNLRMRFH